MLKYSDTRVLIVGAGAIGQIYGKYLQAGGDIVSVLVRPHHEKQATEGYTLHRLGVFGKRANYELFKPDRIMTSIEQVPGEIWNAVWFCVPTHVLREPWVPQLLEYVRGASIVVTAMSDVEYLKTLVPEETIVNFMVSLVSYPGPLEGEDIWPPGMVYYLPPLAPSGFEGQKDRAMACVNELGRGGMPAAWRDNVRFRTEVASALLMPFVLGMHCENWSLSQLRSSETLKWVLGAYEELLKLAQKKYNVEKLGGSQAMFLKMIHASKGLDIIKFGLKMVPKLVPFPFDPYMRFHFTKVQQQTQELMYGHIITGAELGVETPSLRTLYGHWAGLVGAPQVPPITASASNQIPVASASGSHQFPVASASGSHQFPVASASGSHQFPAASPSGSHEFPSAPNSQAFSPPSTGSQQSFQSGQQPLAQQPIGQPSQSGRQPLGQPPSQSVKQPLGQPPSQGVKQPLGQPPSQSVPKPESTGGQSYAPKAFVTGERPLAPSSGAHVIPVGAPAPISKGLASPPPFDPTEQVDSSHYQFPEHGEPTADLVDPTEQVDSSHYQPEPEPELNATRPVNVGHLMPERPVDKTEPVQMSHLIPPPEPKPSPDSSVQFGAYTGPDNGGLEEPTDGGLEEPTDGGLDEPTDGGLQEPTVPPSLEDHTNPDDDVKMDEPSL